MDIVKIKKTIETTTTVEKLWKIGEKIFGKNDSAVCTVTYLIERAYILGKQDSGNSNNTKNKTAAPKKSIM